MTDTDTRNPDGTFKKGVSGNPRGRPRGLDFRALVDSYAAKAGKNVGMHMWLVYRALLRGALNGDVPAARELLNRLCTADPLELSINGAGISDTERSVRIKSLLAIAEARATGKLTDEDVEDLLS